MPAGSDLSQAVSFSSDQRPSLANRPVWFSKFHLNLSAGTAERHDYSRIRKSGRTRGVIDASSLAAPGKRRDSLRIRPVPVRFAARPPTPLLRVDWRAMSSPIFHSAVIARFYDVVISAVAERPSKERRDAIVEPARGGSRPPFQN